MPSHNTKTSRWFFSTLSSICSSASREKRVQCPQSVIQLAQQGHSSLDPVLHGLLRVEPQGDDEVGGVPRGGQDPLALARLVQRANVGIGLLYV